MNERVFITGIGKGLGKCLYDGFISEGYHVYGLLRNKEEHERLTAQCLPNATLILADICDDGCMDTIRHAVGNEPVSLLINNAGIGGTQTRLQDVTAGEVAALIDVHCLGALRVTKALQANLIGVEDPVVVNINSRLGSVAHQHLGTFKQLEVSYSYRIAKAAQNMLTNCLRSELGDNIHFVSLNPGALKTGLAQTDAALSPEASARRIIDAWQRKELKAVNGILELPGTVLDW